MRNSDHLSRDRVLDVALTGGISGAVAGALISVGCARKSLFALPASNVTDLLTNISSF
jgi:hypothetical protein